MKFRTLIKFLPLSAILLLAFAAADGRGSAQSILLLWPYAPVEYQTARKCPVCGLELPDATVKEPDGQQVLFTLLEMKAQDFPSCKFIIPQERSALAMDSDEDRKKVMFTAKESGANAVLYPVLLRYRERVGNRYAVSRPAAVVFHLYLMDADNLEILWRAAYSEEQQPLSNNILKFMQSYRRRFRWVTADRLVEDGLKKVFKDFPGCTEKPQ